MFFEGKVSIWIIEQNNVVPFYIRAIMDLASHWKLMRFFCYSLSHVLLICIYRCFGH
jgi:hypothetical protein